MVVHFHLERLADLGVGTCQPACKVASEAFLGRSSERMCNR